MKIDKRIWVADFETTVYKGQTSTEVWAAALVELYTEDVHLFHSLPEFLKYIFLLEEHAVIYFHNLKFDGSFILDYLLCTMQWKTAYNDKEKKMLPFKYMSNRSMTYSISDLGMWYTLTLKYNNCKIEFRDSLKLLPFSVNAIGKSFGTKHKKLDMEYEGIRYAGCNITPEEAEYIKNDVLVVKEALEIMFSDGHDKLTIGSCCLEEFKKSFSKKSWNQLFPNIYEIPLDKEQYGVSNAGEYIRKSYKGGWCYLVKGKENKVYKQGTTGDVNSLYPSMMHSDSGNRFPTGEPTFWKGNFIPPEATIFNRYFFVRIRTRFKIKKGYLPCIQIKGSPYYSSTEWLITSDVQKGNNYIDHIQASDGSRIELRPELTLSVTDYNLISEHYDLYDFEILDGCYFSTSFAIFDNYINKYAEIKMKSKGALRTEAKLFLNNLYGKMASSPDSSFKVAHVKDDGVLGFTAIESYDKIPGYIPVGAAITSYARNFTIRAAQQNYYGVDKAGFIYADTDSIHCDLKPSEFRGIKVDPVKFNHWKLESCWDEAIFVRQKTYIEHIVAEDEVPIDEPYYTVKAAGMPERCKYYLERSLNNDTVKDEERKKISNDEIAFINKKRTIADFKPGLEIPGNLKAKRIKGGIVLQGDVYKMRERGGTRWM